MGRGVQEEEGEGDDDGSEDEDEVGMGEVGDDVPEDENRSEDEN